MQCFFLQPNKSFFVGISKTLCSAHVIHKLHKSTFKNVDVIDRNDGNSTIHARAFYISSWTVGLLKKH